MKAISIKWITRYFIKQTTVNLTKTAVNPVLPKLITCPELTVVMGLLSDGGEYQTAQGRM